MFIIQAKLGDMFLIRDGLQAMIYEPIESLNICYIWQARRWFKIFLLYSLYYLLYLENVVGIGVLHIHRE